jgi:hypothetical protein
MSIKNDFGRKGQPLCNRVLAAEAVDHPAVPCYDLGVPARIISSRRQLPALLPQQPVHLDERKLAAARQMTRQRRLAARRIADHDDPGHDVLRPRRMG